VITACNKIPTLVKNTLKPHNIYFISRTCYTVNCLKDRTRSKQV